ncbi:hypothetical protein HLB44_06220 [Aquincola sp. S2]|uniref:Uncharacterized protein n=1 Tax=Pseudaquabacterium terrae TaxID=2732868 RepID=A0ABX2EDQ5_9BURK|nr:hypothetical protein [Aquabacterium terrae]NRF66572.1 hypothetical protein [Aquabacterium terrae]
MVSTATLSQPAVAAALQQGDGDELALPGWLYRSEAFAEDLLPADERAAPPAGAGRQASAALYAVTLGVALLALWPAAGWIA